MEETLMNKMAGRELRTLFAPQLLVAVIMSCLIISAGFEGSHNHHDGKFHDDCTTCHFLLINHVVPVEYICIVFNAILKITYAVFLYINIPALISFKTQFPNAPPSVGCFSIS